MTDTHAVVARAAAAATQSTRLLLTSIRIDGDTQLRAAGSEAVVADYAEALKDGAVFPPVVVFHDGTDYWLADGFHRYAAHAAAGLSDVAVTIRDGSRRDALLHAAGANADHGLRRTQADKRKAVLVLLEDPEWRQWSDRAIAERVKVSHPTVAKIRRELDGKFSIETAVERRFVSRHGSTATRSVPERSHQEPAVGSVVATFLRQLPDEVLLLEVRRRGLTAECGPDA